MARRRCSISPRTTGSTHSDFVGHPDENILVGLKVDSVWVAVTWQFLINSRNLNGTATADIGPSSNGTFNQENVAQYNELVRACLATGASCVLDIHNYARFEGQIIGQGGPTNAQFALLWSQLATKVSSPRRTVLKQ
jgi:cellulase (glycosyl hydrolase family 5)